MKKVITAVILAVLLAVLYFAGGKSPEPVKVAKPPETVSTDMEETEFKTQEIPEPSDENRILTQPAEIEEETPDLPVKEELPEASEPEPSPVTEEADETNRELTCILSVRCDTVLDKLSVLSPEKIDYIPGDGVVYAEKEVVFYEGESVFNLLVREMKQNKIHLEFTNTPVYNSAYIEGIANLYEFDCGELSGWMYKVNGVFPNYGCSQYKLSDGDRVEWVFTCDLGADVGGEYSARNGMEKQ